LSRDLNVAQRTSAQFLRTGRKHICREDVGQDIEIGFVAEAPASAVRRHSRLDEREQTFQTVLSPVLHELLTFERRPGLARQAFHVTRTAMNRVSSLAALSLSRGKHAIPDGLRTLAGLRHRGLR